jgi:hypothetical protein
MVALGISEFTFGFSFLYEQTRLHWGDLIAVPVLPNLRQEADQAWDAHLPTNGTDFYYQFKLSDYLVRGNAKYIADGTYNGPYYRFALHKKDENRQHQRLRQHAQSNPHTYYVAPEVFDLDAFNASFLAHQITPNSRIIPLQDCDDINDGEQHYITFQPGSLEWFQHSEKRRREKSFSGKEIVRFYEESRPGWKRIDEEYTANLLRNTVETSRKIAVVEQNMDQQPALPLQGFQPERERPETVLLQASQLLSAFFGLTLVIVGTNG